MYITIMGEINQYRFLCKVYKTKCSFLHESLANVS